MFGIEKDIRVQIIRSQRKTMSLEVRANGEVILRVPTRLPQSEIDLFLNKKMNWIQEHLARIKQQQEKESVKDRRTAEDIRNLAEQALELIPERTAFYAQRMGVYYGKITIRNQKTRWGSCSSKGNLNFNCLLMLVPEEVLDYVIVHELCHRIEMNHSKRFWNEVEQILPDYKWRRKWLKEHGGGIIHSIP